MHTQGSWPPALKIQPTYTHTYVNRYLNTYIHAYTGLLATCSEDSTCRIWDVTKQKQLFSLRGHSDAVYGVNWSNDGNTLVSGGSDGQICVWDAVKGIKKTVYICVCTYTYIYVCLENCEFSYMRDTVVYAHMCMYAHAYHVNMA